MEVSDNINYEGDGVYPEKNNKRTLKTPAQVEALEKFYDEHKYPSDSLKLEFAQKIGLSEKQVSGWFCHRRSKDKKLSQNEVYANNRKHNFPNGAMHDSASGLRQESCNSTKQGERYFDYKEVESKMECGHNSSTAIPEHRGRSSNIESYGVADDMSSGSSTASYERLLKQGVSNVITKPRYSYWNQDNMRMDAKGVKKRGNVMDLRSAYFQADIESPAVSLVRLKLGRQFREDGPLLAVDFDSIPPGAFDSPVRDSNCEPYYVGDTIQLKPFSIPATVREPKMYEKYRSEKISSGFHPPGSGCNRRWQGYTQNEFSRCHLIPKVISINNNECVLNRTCIVKKDEGFTEEASDDYRNNNVRPFKYRPERGYDSIFSHASHLNGLKAIANKSLPYPHPDHTYNAPMSQRELFGARFSNPTLKRNEPINAEDDIQRRRPLKKKKFHKEFDENHNVLCPEVLKTSNAKMVRKMHGKELQQQDHVNKNLENFLWTNPSIRYPTDGAANCDEDRSAGSTSSLD